MVRVFFIGILIASVILLFGLWFSLAGFDPRQVSHWQWLSEYVRAYGALPEEMLLALYIAGGSMLLGLLLVVLTASRAKSRSVSGGHGSKDLHGTARWAVWRDVVKAGLTGKTGVVVGGWKRRRKVQTLRHDGPEHVLCFAPTRSGKGVSLVLPTLLSWQESVLVLDIKGENHALTAGYRSSLGHKVFKFDPASPSGSIRFNPLAEVRIGTGQDIADCQNIASMIIDPDGKGLKDFWMQSGWEWLGVVVLHVLYRERKERGRVASLKDVNAFMSAVLGESEEETADNLEPLLKAMMAFEHGTPYINEEVRRGASKMLIKAGPERSGVHSSAAVQLALYADPIVAGNIAESDFRLDELMNGDKPAALYIVIPPSDIDRLRPLVRMVMNIVLRRLTAHMAFENGASVKHYRHRLLLLLDEFTAVGKLDIFERSLAFMAGYGLKAFIIVQDLAQLQKEYGKEESIISNCHIRIAFAPNKVETAKALSDMAGKTTVVQAKRSRNGRVGEIGSVSDNLTETARPLLTPDECMRLKGMDKTNSGRIIPGDMLIFVAGQPPIRGQQALYFQDQELLARARMPAPVSTRPAVAPAPANQPGPAASEPATAQARPSYRAALAAQNND